MGDENKENEITVKDCLAGAFQALLRGDTKERDRLCQLAQMGFDNGHDWVDGDKPIRSISDSSKN